jgi:hypothetical protein
VAGYKQTLIAVVVGGGGINHTCRSREYATHTASTFICCAQYLREVIVGSGWRRAAFLTDYYLIQR